LSGDGWVEANAWQATWSVSHGIPDLIELMGGKDVLCDKLNYAFEQAADDDFVIEFLVVFTILANNFISSRQSWWIDSKELLVI